MDNYIKKSYQLATELEDRVDLLLERIQALENKNNDNISNTNEVKIQRFNYAPISKDSAGMSFVILGQLDFNPNEVVNSFVFMDITTESLANVTCIFTLDNNYVSTDYGGISGKRTLCIPCSFTNSKGTVELAAIMSCPEDVHIEADNIVLLLIGNNLNFVKR